MDARRPTNAVKQELQAHAAAKSDICHHGIVVGVQRLHGCAHETAVASIEREPDHPATHAAWMAELLGDTGHESVHWSGACHLAQPHRQRGQAMYRPGIAISEALGAIEGDVVVPLEEAADGREALHPSQGSADTMVNPVTESNVSASIP
jgi:hypothetical protein